MIIVYLHYSDLPLNQQVYWTAYHDRTKEVVHLLGEGADTNWQDRDGWSALHWACYNNNRQILSVLVNSNNANINIKDRHKNTPLHDACSRRYFECVSILVVADCHSG